MSNFENNNSSDLSTKKGLVGFFMTPFYKLFALPKAILAILILGILGGLILGSVLLGFEVSKREIFPYELLSKVDRKLEQLVFSKLNDSTEIETALVQVVRRDGVVSEGAFDLQLKWGGALTSFGEDVLVLPYKGRVYAARSPETIHKTAIVAPDNNREAYEKDYKALSNKKGFGTPLARGRDYLRYNDILYYDTSAGRGLIISYTEYHPKDQCVTNTLANVLIDNSIKSVDEVEIAANDWKIFFRSKPCLPFKPKGVAMEGHMSSGRIILEAPSTIYLTSGDFGFDSIRSDGSALSQDPQADYGKVLAIDLVSGSKKIVSSGMRNMQGITQTKDGDIFIVDHGARGGDELNLVKPGRNFGWPLDGYGTLYSGQPLPGSSALGRHDRFDPPVIAWLPSIAVSGLATVSGFHDAWEGDLLVATMADQGLHRIRMVGNKVAYSERIEIGSRIRYVHQHNDGRIVLWTDNHELVFLTAENLQDQTKLLADYFETVDLNKENRQKLVAAIEGCAECHSFSPGQHTRSPGLNKIYRDKIGSTSYQGYSDALKNKGEYWTEDNLELFLSDPQKFASGSLMPAQIVNDPQLAKEVIEYLKYLDKKI